MSVNADAPRLTPDEFLAWEDQQERRHEFIAGELHAMTDESIAHAKITLNVLKLVDATCDPDVYAVFSGSVQLRWSGDLFYPDVTLTCEAYQPGREWLESPVLLAEVLSPSTQARDRELKWPRYQHLPSLQTFMLVAQHRPWVQVFRRADEGWTSTTYTSLDDVFPLTHPECHVTLRDVYRRVPLGLV